MAEKIQYRQLAGKKTFLRTGVKNLPQEFWNFLPLLATDDDSSFIEHGVEMPRLGPLSLAVNSTPVSTVISTTEVPAKDHAEPRSPDIEDLQQYARTQANAKRTQISQQSLGTSANPIPVQHTPDALRDILKTLHPLAASDIAIERTIPIDADFFAYDTTKLAGYLKTVKIPSSIKLNIDWIPSEDRDLVDILFEGKIKIS